MRRGAAGRFCQGLADQICRPSQIGSAGVGHPCQHAAREAKSQQALRLNRLGVERQRMLEQVDGSGKTVARGPLVCCGASPKNVVQHIGMLGGPGGLRSNQF